jgi:mannose-6-phosphate isomerase-like protein (cupin superfamily)
MPPRRDFFRFAAGFALASRLPASTGARLPNMTLAASAARISHEPFGDLSVYFEGATDQIGSMTAGSLRLNPGMSPHPPHTHPEEEFMVITEGTGEILVEGKTTKVGPGTMMYCAGGKLHGITNTGKEPLLFYYYKWKV